MPAPRLQIPPGLRARMRYDKFAGAKPRMLVLESHYWLDGACSRAAAALGWEVAKAPVVMEGKLPRGYLDRLLRTLLEFRPDFVLSINLSGMDEQGLFAEILAEWAVPHVTWFVDNPRTILMNRRCYGNAFAMALSWERAYEPYLREAGFAAVHHLPLAADTALFNAEPALDATGPPAFLGNSMVAFAAREWAWLETFPELAQAIIAAFDSGRVTPAAFGLGLDTLLPPALVDQLDADQKRHAEMYFFIEGTRRKRSELIEALHPLGAQVYGDSGWETVTPEAFPDVHYERDAAAFYRSHTINLNSTSLQMAAAVNQRVFDVPAVGGFLLTDEQGELQDLFMGPEEVASYTSAEECAELVLRFENDADARQRIAQAGRQRVLSAHTYAQRLHTIEALAQSMWG